MLFWALLWTSLHVKMEKYWIVIFKKYFLGIVLCEILCIIFLIKCLCCRKYILCWDRHYLSSSDRYATMSFPLGNSFYESDRLSAKPITRFCNDSNCRRECCWKEKVHQMQITLSATVAGINCMLCMDFRKAPDKPIATNHIKYPISADFLF